MKFSVNATALPGLADLMDRRWQDLTEGRDYLNRNTRIEAGQAGILNWLWGQHEKVVTAVGDFLGSAADGYAAAYGGAVVEASAYYQHTDAQAAVRLDATLPRVDDPGKHDTTSTSADLSLDSSVFADHMCPGDRYAPPVDHHAENPYTFAALDTLSPTSEVRELVWQVSQIAVDLGLLDRPYDVLEEAVKPFSGDWAAFAGCADTYQHIADALNDAANCVMDGVTTIPQVWTGNAADQCAMGLSRFAADLTAAVDPLRATAEAYASTAEQVRAHAEVLAALLTILIDEVVEAALDTASGGVLSVFQAVTTLEDAVQTVLKMRRIVAAAWDIARSFVETGSVSTSD
ncbi:MAG: hypothetical protein V7603_315, partial [Micromonosporaceae bacterium]